jgi:hypothetical protein
MRFPLLLFLTFFSSFALRGFAEQEPKGIVVYQEPASSYAEVIEYRLLRRENALSSSLVSSAGQLKHLKTAGIVADVAYPPYTFDDNFAETVNATLKQVRTLEQQLPHVRPQLALVRGKWERALSVYHQTRKPTPNALQKEASLAVLSLKSARYTNARLLAATYDSATISHNSSHSIFDF